MDVAFDLSRFFALPTAVIVASGIVTGLTVAVVDVWSLTLGVDVVATLSVGHLAQFALTQLALAFVVGLLELLLAQFRTLHIHEQQPLVLTVYQVLNVECGGVLAASRTADSKLSV